MLNKKNSLSLSLALSLMTLENKYLSTSMCNTKNVCHFDDNFVNLKLSNLYVLQVLLNNGLTKVRLQSYMYDCHAVAMFFFLHCTMSSIVKYDIVYAIQTVITKYN